MSFPSQAPDEILEELYEQMRSGHEQGSLDHHLGVEVEEPLTNPPKKTLDLVDSLQNMRDSFESGRFSDFKVVAGERNAEFNVHKVIMSRSQYFYAAMNSSFTESQSGTIKLPEQPEVIDLILQYIYGYPSTMLKNAIHKMPLRQVVLLHGAADKYLLAKVRRWAFDAWARYCDGVLFDNEDDREDEPAGTLFLSLDITSTGLEDVDTAPFEQRLKHNLMTANNGIFHLLSLGQRRAAFRSNPPLFNRLLLDYIKGSKQVHCTCPKCHSTWRWEGFDADVELFCAYCGSKHSLLQYVLTSSINNSFEKVHDADVPKRRVN